MDGYTLNTKYNKKTGVTDGYREDHGQIYALYRT